MNSFFKRYILKSVFLIVAFFIVNIALLFLFILFYGFSSNTDEHSIKMDEIIKARTPGQEEEIKQKLREEDAFYFILDSDGNIIESENLPKNLDHPYSRSEIASFSRWYLEDYPVLTRILEDGRIAVLGYPVNSLLKYNTTFTPQGFFWELFLVPFLLIGNLLIFISIQIITARRLQKEIEPIVEGIDDLSNGKAVDLELKGQLKDVGEKLNHSSNLIQSKEKARIEWINEISHDIRTPLSVISNSAEFIQEDFAAELILSNVQKIKDLIEQLNLENKLNSGRIPLTKEPHNLYLILSQCVADFLNENEIPDFPVSIEITSAFETAQVLLDSNLFTRSIRNLLENTLHHGGEDAGLIIRGSVEGDRVLIEISDTGCGIDKVELDNILNSPSLYSRKGLGLRFVKKVIAAHGGSVEFESAEYCGFKTTIILNTKSP